MSKARDLADSAQEINILDGKSFLDEDNLASDSATGIASQQSIKAYVDGITTTNITSTGALNSGSITSGFGNINNGSSTITTTGAITGGSFVIGSADINENDLESIDGITAGTVSASKAVVVNTNKDITGFRNLTATGTITGSLSGTLSGSLSSTTTATTQAESDDSTKIATTAYVTDKITTLIGGAPSTLNDLNELAAAINDDANYNSTLTTALGTKLPKAGGTMTGDVLYNDNVKAKFGAGSDLQISHTGANSQIIDAGNGDLYIGADSQLGFLNAALTEWKIKADSDGAVKLYYDNSQKLATTSTGIDVTGTVTSTGLIGNATNFDIKQNTSDGSDSKRTRIGGGGDVTSSRGAMIEMSGNEHGNGGMLFLHAGHGGAYSEIRSYTANTERMRIDSSGRVGIGQASPEGLLHLNGDTNSNGAELYLQVNNNNTTDNLGAINFGNNVDSTLSRILGGTSGANNSSYLSFSTSSTGTQSERMRIDSAGYVVIGSTLQGSQNAVTISQAGFVQARRASGPAGFFDRLTDDGTIIQLRKGGADVGSIGTRASQLSIGSADTGLEFNNANDNVLPHNTSTNGGRDAAIDLGASGTRFKDVYAVNFHGDGSNLTGVGGSTAWDAVGTYALGVLWHPTANNPGSTRSGSQIRACQLDETSSSGWTLSGTWRQMGFMSQGYRGILWVRIS